ncbi:MAG: right-handed parallel beta-helix repeat-containing protein [Oscillospiraceae bacterium]|nr:right-handed parallel beta-helix repeat-containing protein [Oscillospiraceae bacterium]
MKKLMHVFVLLCIFSICFVPAIWGAGFPTEWTSQRSALRPEQWTEFNGRRMFTEADIPDFIKNKETTFKGVKVATGATVTKEALLKEDTTRFKVVTLTDPPYNAIPGGGTPTARHNTDAINQAMKDVSAAGGGTVILPPGEFAFYTIELQSNANIRLDARTVLLAAIPTSTDNYLKPELNPYIGLQDFGHSHFANSLIYGFGVHDIMIYGEGLISGSYYNPLTGYRYTTMTNSGSSRGANGTRRRSDEDLPQAGSWIPTAAELANIGKYGVATPGGSAANGLGAAFAMTANKAIAVEDCQRLVFSGFDMLNVGHFAFISAGVEDCLIENIVIDSNRDGLDIDTIKDVTIRNCVINTLQDDAIVVKASFGVKKMFRTENILIYNCVVSGYDSGSVMAGTFTHSRPSSGPTIPTGRFKMGTEATTGFDRVTVANLLSVQSTGFCVESVDGNTLTNIIGYNLTMDDVAGGPIFIKAGDRSRYPVTGKTTDDILPVNGTNERMTDSFFVIPNTAGYLTFPIQRYQPRVTVNNTGVATVTVNNNNFYIDSGDYYLYKWNGTAYEPDMSAAIPAADRGRYTNAVGAADLAKIEDIYIGNVKATNIDPRLPIHIHGMVNSKLKNVTLENIDVVYRGGLTLRDAAEQRSFSSSVSVPYAEYMVPAGASGSYSFLSSSTARMRRVSAGNWVEDPYNVPESTVDYPEPTNFGLLPAYGLYARHVDGLTVTNFKTSYQKTDTRPAIVLDDVQNGAFTTVDVQSEGTSVVLVNHNFKRKTGFELYPNEPYIQTKVENVTGLPGAQTVTLDTPQPGTPADTLFTEPTVPSWDGFTVVTQRTEHPRTVNRPYFKGDELKSRVVSHGETVSFKVETVNPANFISASTTYPVTVTAESLPWGASFAGDTFTWTVANTLSPGMYKAIFVAQDDLLPVRRTVNFILTDGNLSPVQPDLLSDETGANADVVVSQTDSVISVTFPAGSNFSEGEIVDFWFYRLNGSPEAVAEAVSRILPKANPNGSITFTFSVDNVDGNGTDLESGNYSIVYTGNISGETGYTKGFAVAGSEPCPPDGGNGGCSGVSGAFLLVSGLIIGLLSKKK